MPLMRSSVRSGRAKLAGVLGLAALALVLFVAPVATAEDSAPPEAPLPAEAEDITAITSLYADWREAVESGSVTGYTSILHRDVRLMPPGAPDIHGRDSYAAFLEPVFQMASYRVEPTSDFDIEILGDVAMVRYDYTVHLSIKDPTAAVQAGALTDDVNRSKYFDVLIRDEEGAWKVYRHTWNAAPPPRAAIQPGDQPEDQPDD